MALADTSFTAVVRVLLRSAERDADAVGGLGASVLGGSTASTFEAGRVLSTLQPERRIDTATTARPEAVALQMS